MKSEIREKYKKIRSQMTKEEVMGKSKLAQSIFLNSEIYKNAKCIMGYMPLGNETETTDIINASYNDGKKVVFPVTEKVSGKITPILADKNTEFKKGNFSVYEPVGGKLAESSCIDVVLVPGIAFDKSGARVGFGKGCYDRFLKNTSAVKVGFCYGFQICDKINSDSYDISMDYIITEAGITEIL